MTKQHHEFMKSMANTNTTV